MRRLQLLTNGFLVSLTWLCHGASIQLNNNQPFTVRMPVEIRNFQLSAGNWRAGNIPIQASGTNAIIVADIPAESHQQLEIRKSAGSKDAFLIVTQSVYGLALSYAGTDLGQLSWGLYFSEPRAGGVYVPPAGQDSPMGKKWIAPPAMPAGAFSPLPLLFEQRAMGPVFDLWHAETPKSGLRVSVDVRCYHEGFLDVDTRVTYLASESTSNIYAAAICRWEQQNPAKRTYCYDNHIAALGDHAHSLFREGEGRHLAIQRGVDWVRTEFADGQTVAWMNDFAPSFTVVAAATAKTPAHYTGANASLLGREVQTDGASVCFVTELARSSVRSFRDRLKENVLMPKGESVAFSSRLVFRGKDLSDQRADETFVAWNSYNEQRESRGLHSVDFGTPSVRFGTSYFPYSTLGETFDELKLPGMDRESFWPLAADTVNEWRVFADDIRRDLRIAKAMGFQLIRLHHLELLAPIKKEIRDEYLDFLFSELRHLGLRALLDIYTSPAQITALLQRYADVVDSVEVENETLIWGIPLDRPKEWKELYTAIKKTAPHVEVHFTGYNNTGMFDRLTTLGVPYDRVCLHSYIDTLEAIPSARGYSLALSSYATKAQKPPLITEWNWRGLTQMHPDDRAKIYPQIIEGAIGTRGIPDFYQFQFNETLCPNPRVGRGNILRHYELLHLSRRPKPEALALCDIIRKYSSPRDPVKVLEIPHTAVMLNTTGHGLGSVAMKNTSRNPLKLGISVESGESLFAELEGKSALTLKPGEERTLKVRMGAIDAQPGFYHAFLRVAGPNGFLRYGWIEARLPGIPNGSFSPNNSVIEKGPPTSSPQHSPQGKQTTLPTTIWRGPINVIYGPNAAPQEIETAIAIAETLESASGRPIEALRADPLVPKSAADSFLIIVGTPESTHNIRNIKGKSIAITGADASAVEHAGMKFIIDYWKTAKDSAAARVGLVSKDLPRGGDATKLP